MERSVPGMPRTDMKEQDRYHVFGIRHHGPGSARSLRDALTELQPDCVLIEGPADAAKVLPLVMHEGMRAPVALLLYRPDRPSRAAFFPFAAFSPEWQALRFSYENSIPVSFIDLPYAHQLAMKLDEDGEDGDSKQEQSEADTKPKQSEADIDDTQTDAIEADLSISDVPDPTQEFFEAPTMGIAVDPSMEIRDDPIGWLAHAAGYTDSETWWERMVEQRSNSAELFNAIAEAMAALRTESIRSDSRDREETLRESFMRQGIRNALKEGYQRIAVVCGAWHVPALKEMPPAKEDSEKLRGLPKVKVEATWIPWSNGRLSFESGYGAGVNSPGWYHHLWTSSDCVSERWIVKVAQLLRAEDLDASSAHIIEAVRLAETLSAMRGRSQVGLDELMESVKAVFCHGNNVPIRLIHNKLIVGEILGEVPPETPAVPLQLDLQKQQKRLRLKAEATEKLIDLDLRKPNDLEKSHLLHRLNLLGINWGKVEEVSGKSGTFHELWLIQWQPELSVDLIEASMWGKTVIEAAHNRACDNARSTRNLGSLTALLEMVMLCSLPDAACRIMEHLENQAAVATDTRHLMQAIPPLARVARYGNVRQADAGTIAHVVDGLVARACIGLPPACRSLNDEAADDMFKLIGKMHEAIHLLQKPEQADLWQTALARLMDMQGVHGLVAGRATRYLLELQAINKEQCARRFSLELSQGNEASQAARWLEGFMSGSGLLLLHDDALWSIVDEWLCSLPPETFTEALPVMRRTFSTFANPERRQIGERVQHESNGEQKVPTPTLTELDEERADRVLPVLQLILGLSGGKHA